MTGQILRIAKRNAQFSEYIGDHAGASVAAQRGERAEHCAYRLELGFKLHVRCGLLRPFQFFGHCVLRETRRHSIQNRAYLQTSTPCFLHYEQESKSPPFGCAQGKLFAAKSAAKIGHPVSLALASYLGYV